MYCYNSIDDLQDIIDLRFTNAVILKQSLLDAHQVELCSPETKVKAHITETGD
jgi:hypothetical protein